ncbi:hypothetical protein CGSSp14BS69_03278 [Streptococcus pneumoniae SP14-BS69]|nr:hypothetical protein CGSSp14BS69_03278 [Streptococcus pneumoniae SP14-BS69]
MDDRVIHFPYKKQDHKALLSINSRII